MSLNKEHIEKNIDKEVNLYYSYVLLENSDEVFAQVGKLDDEFFIMKRPLRVIRNYDQSSGTYDISFEEYIPFTDDVFLFIEKTKIVTTASLNDMNTEIYIDAVNNIEKIKSNQLVDEDDSFNDEDKSL